MRRSAFIALVLATAAAAGAAPARAEYYCSPGFEPSYGRCIATASTDQVDLYLNEPGGYIHEDAPPVPLVHHRHRRHGLRARY
jgi:hypothetical protein